MGWIRSRRDRKTTLAIKGHKLIVDVQRKGRGHRCKRAIEIDLSQKGTIESFSFVPSAIIDQDILVVSDEGAIKVNLEFWLPPGHVKLMADGFVEFTS